MQMLRPSLPISLLSIAMLIGCAAQYQPPPPGSTPVARLRVLQHDNDNTRAQRLHGACLQGYKEELRTHFDTIGWLKPGHAGGEDRQRLQMPDPPEPPAGYTEVRIEAGKPFHLGYTSTRFISGYPASTISTCRQGVTFLPEAGKDYELVVSRPRGGGCYIALAALEQIGNETRRVPTHAKRIDRECSAPTETTTSTSR